MGIIGKNLKKLRERKALTTRELAKLSGVSQCTIVRIENTDNNVHPTTLRKIADALGVSVERLTKGI